MRKASETFGTILNTPTFKLYGSQRKKTKKKGTEKDISVENFPNMGKEIVSQAQEVQRVPYRLNPRRNTLRHILIKLTEIKLKEKILKAAREKQQVTYKGNPICFTTDLSAETETFCRPEGNGRIYLKY